MRGSLTGCPITPAQRCIGARATVDACDSESGAAGPSERSACGRPRSRATSLKEDATCRDSMIVAQFMVDRLAGGATPFVASLGVIGEGAAATARQAWLPQLPPTARTGRVAGRAISVK